MSLYDNIVGYWRFDERLGNAIDVVGSNDGTVNSSVVRNTDGVINTGYYFPGTNFVNVTLDDTSALSLPSDFGVSFWYKGTTTGSYEGLIGNYDPSVDGFIVYKGTTGYINASIQGVYVVRGATYTVIDGEWHHIVVTRSGSTGYIYVDGQLDSTGFLYTNTASSSTNSITVGTYPSGYDALTGYIDEIGIWDRYLTSDDVLSLYNNGEGNTFPFNGETSAANIKLTITGGYWDDTDTWVDTDTWED